MLLKFHLRTFFAVLYLMAAVACPSDPRKPIGQDLVAKVGDAAIEKGDFLAELIRMGALRISSEEERQPVIDFMLQKLIEEELLVLAASGAAIAVDRNEVDRAIRRDKEPFSNGAFRRMLHEERLTPQIYRKRVKRHLLIENYLSARFALLGEPSEQDLLSYYQQHKNEFQTPAQVRARQILLQTEEEAKYILGQIKKRKLNAEEAARKYSKAPEGENGGDLGWFAKDELPPIFDTCFGLKKGRRSDVVSSEYGFHIFELIDRRPQRIEPFKEVKSKIKNQLMRKAQQAAKQEILEDLKKKIEITTFPSILVEVGKALAENRAEN